MVKRFGSLFLGLLFCLSLAAAFLPYTVHAATVDGVWKSNSEIDVGNDAYVDKTGDSNPWFFRRGDLVQCHEDEGDRGSGLVMRGDDSDPDKVRQYFGKTSQTIKDISSDKINAKLYKYNILVGRRPANTTIAYDTISRSEFDNTSSNAYKTYDYAIECRQAGNPDTVKLTDPAKVQKATYAWLDENHIQDTKGSPTFTRLNDLTQFVDNKDTDEPACKDYINVPDKANHPEKGNYYAYGVQSVGGNCTYNDSNKGKPYPILIGGLDNKDKTTGVSKDGTAVTDAAAPVASNTHVDCQTGGPSFNPFTLADHAIGWFLCPLLDGAQGIVNSVGGWVVDQLEFDVSSNLENDGVAPMPVKDAWNAFRVISLSLLIVVALAGLLLGSFIDAYTVKKILPRLLIAIIAISLSWDLLKLAINFTNATGAGIRALIDSPFSSLPNPQINPTLILGAGAAATGLTTILGALSLVGTAALAVLFAFIFTILRMAAIIALVIFAPIAILAWILPGTHKLWNFWQTGLTGALLMFPIVAAFLAIGSAFGKIVYANDSINVPLKQTIALIATYAPYFLIPKAFTMAGGVVGNLSGMVNDRSRGAFDRLKKFRQDQGSKRRHDVTAGKYFKPSNEDTRLGRLKNKVSSGVQTAALSPQMGIGTSGNRLETMRGNLANARDVAEWEHSTDLLRNNAFIKAHYQDDDMMHGVAEGGGDFDETKKIIKEFGGARFENDDGTTNEDELNRVTAAALRFRREAGPSAGITAMRGMATSSTAWKTFYKKHDREDLTQADGKARDKNGKVIQDFDLDADGNKIIDGKKSNVKMLENMNQVLGHHRGNMPKLVAELRAGQDQAGRPENGSASFSDTMYASELLTQLGPRPSDPAAAAAYDVRVSDISDSLSMSIMEGKPLAAVIGAKEQPADNITRVAVDATKAVLKDERKGKWGAVAEKLGAGSDAHKNAIVTDIARLAGSLSAAANYSDAGRDAQRRSMGTKIDLSTLHPEIENMVTLEGFQNVPTGVLGPDGKEIVKSVELRTKPEDGKITLGQIIKNLERTNPAMADTMKIYYEQATAAQAERAAQAAQAGGAAAMVAGTTPGQTPVGVNPFDTPGRFGGPK